MQCLEIGSGERAEARFDFAAFRFIHICRHDLRARPAIYTRFKAPAQIFGESKHLTFFSLSCPAAVPIRLRSLPRSVEVPAALYCSALIERGEPGDPDFLVCLGQIYGSIMGLGPKIGSKPS